MQIPNDENTIAQLFACYQVTKALSARVRAIRGASGMGLAWLISLQPPIQLLRTPERERHHRGSRSTKLCIAFVRRACFPFGRPQNTPYLSITGYSSDYETLTFVGSRSPSLWIAENYLAQPWDMVKTGGATHVAVSRAKGGMQ